MKSKKYLLIKFIFSAYFYLFFYVFLFLIFQSVTDKKLFNWKMWFLEEANSRILGVTEQELYALMKEKKRKILPV